MGTGLSRVKNKHPTLKENGAKNGENEGAFRLSPRCQSKTWPQGQPKRVGSKVDREREINAWSQIKTKGYGLFDTAGKLGGTRVSVSGGKSHQVAKGPGMRPQGCLTCFGKKLEYNIWERPSYRER